MRIETIAVARSGAVVFSGHLPDSKESRHQGEATHEAIDALLCRLSDAAITNGSDQETRDHLPLLLLELEWGDGHKQEVLDVKNQGTVDLGPIEKEIRTFLRSVVWAPGSLKESRPVP